MNDPPANTYTYEMNRQLDEAILKARMDNDVHVIVLTGAGDKFFSAGANIKMLSTVDPTFKYYFCLHANETLLRLEHTPKLVIAALNGHTVGGGLEIAMAADMRIARQDAGKIGLPEVNLGVLPGTGGTQRLSRMVGKSQGHRADRDRQHVFVRRGEGAGHRQRHLRARELHGERDGVRAPVLPAEQGVQGRGDASSAPSRPAGRFRWKRRWRWSANAAAAVQQPGRQGRPGRLRREAPGDVHGK